MFKDTQKSYYDRNTKPLKPLKNGDVIRLRIPGEFIKTPGKVVRPAETPRSCIISQGNIALRRNHRDLIKTQEQNTESLVEVEESIDRHSYSFLDNSCSVSCSVGNSAHSRKLVKPTSGRVIKPPHILVTEC